MKALITFCLMFVLADLVAQPSFKPNITYRSATKVDASIRFIPTQKGQFSAAQPSSFVAIPAIKQTTPPVVPVLVFSPAVAYVPDTSLLETTPSSKSTYPIKNVSVKKE